MTEYIYIVKCDGCEDEFFNFFTDARMQCDLVMSKHPIITQVEVQRNDFGECTDHCDLGTVWSWEDAMKETEAEPTKSVFTKDDLKDMTDDKDPEFDTIDNSVDFDTETSEVSDEADVRKPVPDGMTIDQLKEAMEENEDTVECAGCEELFPKDECVHKDGIGYLCGDCEDRIVKCTWCEELYDKGECRYEVDLGWLCSRCEMAIKSRGETLTFREGNYWDFLDEEVEPEKHTWTCYLNGKDVGTVEAATEEEAYREMEKSWYINNEDAQVVLEDELDEELEPKEVHDLGNEYDGGYPADEDLTEASLSDVAAAANADFGTDFDERDLLDFAGVEDGEFFDDIETWPELQSERKRTGKQAAMAKRAASKLEELEEAADYRKRLVPCPECGANESFDHETGICLECGFNI